MTRRPLDLLERWLPLVSALLLSILLLPVGYMLSHPFWLDEAWVAVGTRSPLAYIRALAFPGPVGFALLLRLPVPGEQGMRMFTLAFSAAAVYMAFLLGRDVGWEKRRQSLVVGAMAALAVAMSPWWLLRIDLKHYTAEAFMALVLLWWTGRVESTWDRRRLVVLAGMAAVFSIFGWTSMFVSVGAFLGLFVIAAYRREWIGLRDVVTAGVLVAAAFAGVWGLLIRPFSSSVADYWEFAYLVGGPLDIARQTWWRFSDLMNFYPSHARFVAIPIFLIGLMAIARRKPATAVGVVITGLFAMTLGRLEFFPFLDRRTSHYLLIMFIAVAGVGVGWIAIKLLGWRPSIGAVGVAGLAALLIWPGIPWFQRESLPRQDVRSQVRYVEAERVEGDVIVISRYARFGFAYYWRGGSLEFNNVVNFTPRVVGDGVIVIESFDIDRAVAEAIEAAIQPGATGRVWVVRSHLQGTGGRAAEWDAAYLAAGVEAVTIPVGIEPLQVFEVEP